MARRRYNRKRVVSRTTVTNRYAPRRRLYKRWHPIVCEKTFDVDTPTRKFPFTQIFEDFVNTLQILTTAVVIRSIKVKFSTCAGTVATGAVRLYYPGSDNFLATCGTMKVLPAILIVPTRNALEKLDFSNRLDIKKLIICDSAGVEVGMSSSYGISVTIKVKMVYLMQDFDSAAGNPDKAWTAPELIDEKTPAGMNAKIAKDLYDHIKARKPRSNNSSSY